MSLIRRALFAFVSVALFTCSHALPSFAAEAPKGEAPSSAEVADELIDALDTSLRAKDAEAIVADVERIAEAYAQIADEKARRALVKGVGRATRSKSEDVRRATLRAFAAMGDQAAWKYIAPFLKQRDRAKRPELFSEAIRTVEALHPDQAVKPLIALVQKSKNLGVASRAMEALAAFKDSRLRPKILDAIISTTRKEKPGVKGRDNPNWFGPRYTGEQARNRWQALAGPMVETANALTGQDASSPTEWFTLWSEFKRKPDRLFVQS